MNRGLPAAGSFFRRLLTAAAWIACLFFVAPFSRLSFYYARPLATGHSPRPSDVIVLMSHGQAGQEWLSPVGAQRTLGALKLYREGFARMIISSGSNPSRQWDQAALQAIWLQRGGVPADAILVERQSQRTRGSAVEVARIMRERGWRSLVVVVSELDAPRVDLVFRKEGLRPSFLEVPAAGPPIDWFSVSYLSVFYHATYEYAGLWYYWTRGWV